MKKETFESDEVNSLHGRILKPVVYKLGETMAKKAGAWCDQKYLYLLRFY